MGKEVLGNRTRTWFLGLGRIMDKVVDICLWCIAGALTIVGLLLTIIIGFFVIFS